MPRKPKFDPAIHDDNPAWTAEDFAKARPASELPADVLAQFRNTKVGRPRSDNPKVPVKLRLDGVVLDALRATGPGWQTRINDLLKSRISRGKVKFDTPEPVKRKRA
ncbi:MAG: BrnA antitoxin family protein [Rhodopseudomonas palustris]|uniref:BrnA antitoxin family protein n=1 Tax=Rhodopseudomonas palustris TaxID=1076 RepID=A0A933RV82_RHOPL|nr:BrnA antitoxin family protein [Rhodopseudomonas palustris]